MATVTKPIALDESINTTEQTPRNIADVLAEELSNIAQSIGAINQKYKIVQTLPDTDISTTAIYLVPKSTAQTDNTYDEYINLTGTSLGWEKIGDTEIDLSDYYTESEVDALLAEKADVSDIPVLPTADEQTSTTGEFETVTGGLLGECKVQLEPVQDLHGYDHPWAGGAGKNKLPLVLADIKSINTGGTWSGNTYTVSGITFTIHTDNDGNITSINVSGTATTGVSLLIKDFTEYLFSENSYILNDSANTSAISSGSCYVSVERRLGASGNVNYPANTNNASRNGAFTVDYSQYDRYRVLIYMPVNTVVNNAVFYPMVRLSTESDATFEPYSNICPISGHTQSDVEVVGKNRLPLPVAETKNGVTLTHNSDGSITFTGTASANTYFDFFPNGDFNSSKYSGYKVYLNNSGVSPSVNTITFRVSKSDRVSLQSITYDGTAINTSEDGLYFAIRIQGGYNTNGCTFKPMMIAPDETDTTFEPYHGKTYTTAFGQTVYGGTLDLVSGVLTIDRAIVDLGTLTWLYNSTYNFFYSTNVDNPSTDMICSCYEVLPTTKRGSDMGTVENGKMAKQTDVSNILVKNTVYTDATTFKTAMNGQTLVYPLATPTVIQLTPQQIISLVGKNYVDAPLDGQSIVEVKFKQLMTIDDVLALIGG